MKQGSNLPDWQKAVLKDALKHGMTLKGIAFRAEVPYHDLYCAYSGRAAVGKVSMSKIQAFIADYIKVNNVVSDFIAGK